MSFPKQQEWDVLMKAYKRDSPKADSHGWIQWKGTQPCMDLYCKCGFQGHVDADYFYYRAFCPQCDRQFLVGQVITLIELTPEEAAIDAWEPKSIDGFDDYGASR